MAAVVPGMYYYAISDADYNNLVSLAANETDPTLKALYQSLVNSFSYTSIYVPGMRYANTEDFDTEEEYDWMLENTDGFAYWFRNSQQPGNWYQG